jgi:hypothetical protein
MRVTFYQKMGVLGLCHLVCPHLLGSAVLDLAQDMQKDGHFEATSGVLIDFLSQTATGSTLLEHAKDALDVRTVSDLTTKLEFGTYSYVDSAAKTTFIVINKEIGLWDQILELGHELVHVVYKEKGHLTTGFKTQLARQIISDMEGPGGEAHALFLECQIAQELRITPYGQTLAPKAHACWQLSKLTLADYQNLLFQVGSQSNALKSTFHATRLESKLSPRAAVFFGFDQSSYLESCIRDAQNQTESVN